MVAGVLAGFAEYFEIDPTLVRVIFVVIAILIAGFPALAIYGVCWLIIPSKHGRSIIEKKMDEKRTGHPHKHDHVEDVSRDTTDAA